MNRRVAVLTAASALFSSMSLPAIAGSCSPHIPPQVPHVCYLWFGHLVCVNNCPAPPPGWTPSAGFRCGLEAGTDPTGEEGVMTGVVDAGPLVFGEPTTVTTGSITCAVQVGLNSTHSGTDAFTVTGSTTTGVMVIPPTQASFEATEDENVYLCSQVNVEGGSTYYWNASNDPLVDGAWSTEPGAACDLAISASTPGEDEFPFDLVTPVVCSVLAPVLPPEGDVPPVLDCPPFG